MTSYLRFRCWSVLLSWQYTNRFLSPHVAANVARVLSRAASRTANHRDGLLLGGKGRAKSALIIFKWLRVREMGGTSNGPKIRNKISATFRHLNFPCSPLGVSCRHANNNVRTRKLAKKGTCTSLS